ncbi:hypothetical protein [Corynebacterium liangguodongii]|uniref:Uncharacterized protein n=1 Tax=Corynebacterium liangguodongii TaxID=2079535 RepID=A0A2S0WGJ7_9CORY|nr:hypothetical protein [Corynebacterium liangguodongii]AWB84844.1 hypothetical protein C3E79_10470 [Corynebacterium liangguodongii]PWB99201.1 hypothetical protein DF219_08085 [Corynebacterium liangguodongii]
MARTRAPYAAALALAAATLTACGSSTVESSEVAGTTASASPSAETPAPASTGASSSTAPSSSTSSSPRSSAAPAPAGADQPAQEVDSVPEQASAYTPEEQAYLEALRNNGINVDGVEDQLTGTGFSVCEGNTITRDAVSGQLVEQRRTDQAFDALNKLIDDSAHEHLC